MKKLPVYSIPEFDKGSKTFYANSLKQHLIRHHFIKEPHKHDFYLCVIFTQGKGTHEIDFVSYPVKPGSVFFLSPGSMHDWTLSDDADGFIFFHSRDFYEINFHNRSLDDFPFFYSGYNPPHIAASLKNLDEILQLSRLLLREFDAPGPMAEARLCSLTDLIYIGLSRLYYNKKSVARHNAGYIVKLKKLEGLINEHFLSRRSPSEYAEMMNMSPKHLNRIVNSTLKKTVTDMIADRLVLESKRLLVRSSLTVSEVADRLGFADISYFSRFFKKRTGDTPANFSKQYKLAGVKG